MNNLLDAIIFKNIKNIDKNAIVKIEGAIVTYKDLFKDIFQKMEFLSSHGCDKYKRAALLPRSNYDDNIITWFLALSCFSEVIIVDANKSIDDKSLTINSLNINYVIELSNGNKAITSSSINSELIVPGEKLGSDINLDFSTYKNKTKDFDDNKIALFLQTSGTTGAPKTIGLTHNSVKCVLDYFNNSLGLRSDDIGINMMPMFHYHGLIINTLNALWSGGCMVISNGYDYDTLKASVERHNVTWFSAVSGLLNAVLEKGKDDKSVYQGLRFIRSSSHPLSAHSLEALEYLFNCPVVESYGLTEVGTICCNPVDNKLRKINSVGQVVKGVDVELRDEKNNVVPTNALGEIYARSKAMVHNYVDTDRGKEDFVDGWFKTEDMAYFDEDGFLFIQGRKKDSILVNNQYFFPTKTEALISKITGAKESILVNLNEGKGKDNLIALVVGKLEIDKNKVNKLLSNSEDSKIILEHIEEFANLEYNAIGKPLKTKVREEYKNSYTQKAS
ncbi:MAG: AMP-binding protein [Alphaproteobacteria bacterium]|nr:AMP-binding protein [Alphaproteobacteria bacterium]